jgi:hypothetical protein
VSLARPTRARPVYRLRPGTSLDYDGDPVESWDAPARDRLRGAVVQDVTSTEKDGVVRRLTESERRLLVPGRADLHRDDRVEVDGGIWRVDGDPVTRRSESMGTFTSAQLVRFTA